MDGGTTGARTHRGRRPRPNTGRDADTSGRGRGHLGNGTRTPRAGDADTSGRPRLLLCCASSVFSIKKKCPSKILAFSKNIILRERRPFSKKKKKKNKIPRYSQKIKNDRCPFFIVCCVPSLFSFFFFFSSKVLAFSYYIFLRERRLFSGHFFFI